MTVPADLKKHVELAKRVRSVAEYDRTVFANRREYIVSPSTGQWMAEIYRESHPDIAQAKAQFIKDCQDGIYDEKEVAHAD